MSFFDQIVYRAPLGPTGIIQAVATSLQEKSQNDRWLKLLRPWLQAGGPLGRGYLNYGSQAALVRWRADATSGYAWQFAHALIGPAAELTASHALRQPLEPPPELLRLSRSSLTPVADATAGTGRGMPGTGMRGQPDDAGELLVPLLSRIMAGEQGVRLPWTAPGEPEMVLWGLIDILEALGDQRPISFLTFASDHPAAPPGLFVSFRQGLPAPAADPGCRRAAAEMVTAYADAGAVGLRRTLTQHRILEPGRLADRIARLLEVWPAAEESAPAAWESAPAAWESAPAAWESAPEAPPAPPRPVTGPPGSGARLICPVCLSALDWGELPRLHWDSARNGYTEITIPPDASPQQRAYLERGAMVRCPDHSNFMTEQHYLPADYGHFGRPVVLGFVGMTSSGKSHLLTAMVGEIERGGLLEYGIESRPLAAALHRAFLDRRVRPLLEEHKVLPGTGEGVVTFEDAFLIGQAGGPERPVALFDVAGGELAKAADTAHFLEIADGLIFVIDPGQLDPDGLGDQTFAAVLDVVRSSSSRSPSQVSAAIVVNKADMIRFDDPVSFWLRADGHGLDAAEFQRESADVYAYLHGRGAAAWARRPYQQCGRATLHFASPTGGARQPGGEAGVFPRGVTPRRVLRPLVAMLAMTGVLTGAEAQRVGT